MIPTVARTRVDGADDEDDDVRTDLSCWSCSEEEEEEEARVEYTPDPR